MEALTEGSRPNAMARLYDAALKGDVHSFNNLLEEDALILERCIFERSSRYTQSPLHVAAKMGHSKIVKTFLEVKPDLCFVHDEDGMTPIHVAAIHGRIDVLETFLVGKPHAIRERTKSGETVLHLCVKHNQKEALKLLLKRTDEVHHQELADLLNSKDSGGNTILHLAVIGKQAEIVTLLLKHERMIELNAVNIKDLTALDCHLLGIKKKKLCWCMKVNKRDKDDEIRRSLEKANALKGKDALKIRSRYKWVKDQSNALMVAASVIAAIAFQVAISPPGGFWQDEGKSEASSPTAPHDGHVAGKYVQEKIEVWPYMLVFNTIALASSLSVILLLISGLPNNRFFVGLLRITMWIAVTATVVTYIISLGISTNFENNHYDGPSIMTPIFTLIVWICLLVILILGRAQKFLVKFIIKRPTFQSIFDKYCKPSCCVCFNDGHV